MPKNARRYDLFLPVNFNDGRLVPKKFFDSLELRLLNRFKGFTAQRREFPLRGIWQGKLRIHVDRVIIVTIFDFRRHGSARFLAALKRDLLDQFEQEEILLTEVATRIH